MRAEISNKEQKHCCKHVYRCCKVLTQGSAGTDSLLPLLDVRGTAVLGPFAAWLAWLKLRSALKDHCRVNQLKLVHWFFKPLSSDVDWSTACMSKNEDDVCLSTGERHDSLTVRLESVHEENRLCDLNPVIIYFFSFFTENLAKILACRRPNLKIATADMFQRKSNWIILFY